MAEGLPGVAMMSSIISTEATPSSAHFCHPFLDAFHHFGAAFQLRIMRFQFFQILLDQGVGLHFQCEGVSADTYFFNFSHCCKVLMVSTRSFHEAFISCSSVRPASLMQ